jgi:hypothetical protein
MLNVYRAVGRLMFLIGLIMYLDLGEKYKHVSSFLMGFGIVAGWI